MGQKDSTRSLAPFIRVVIADPYPVITCGLRKMMEDDPRLKVAGEASTLLSARRKVLAERPDVALIDWSMACGDLELTSAFIRSEAHATAIIFLTVTENSGQKQEMLRLGARGFLSKWCSAARLRTAIAKASHREMSVKPAAATVAGGEDPSLSDARQRIAQLTQRELDVIPLVCGGLKNKQIALRLGISESTVWHHLTSVFTKLQVADRLGLAAFVYAQGPMVPLPPPGSLRRPERPVEVSTVDRQIPCPD